MAHGMSIVSRKPLDEKEGKIETSLKGKGRVLGFGTTVPTDLIDGNERGSNVNYHG